MHKSFWNVVLLFAASVAPTTLRADDSVYVVNVNVGGDMLTGTITTDGKIGDLEGQDIAGFSLSDSQHLLGTSGISSSTGGFVDVSPGNPTTPTTLGSTSNGTLVNVVSPPAVVGFDLTGCG